MTGVDFLNLAIELAARRDEAGLRSAFSRAYYGSFHATRDLLGQFGIHLSRAEKEHAKVAHCFLNSGCAIAQEIGKRLENLRLDRNSADYDLAVTRFQNTFTVLAAVRSAQRIVDLASQCQTEPDMTPVRDGLRRYVSEVLRLPVTD